MSNEQKQEYLEFAKEIARDAGVVMRRYFLQPETEWKSDNTPVTKADTEINSMVIERIKNSYPDHSVYGEEEQAMVDGSKYTWVCDPVDGTLPYSLGLPISSFSLALCEDGESIVGVVYDPFMDRLFWATQGGGAFCNDNRLRVNDQSFENSVIDVQGFGNPPELPMIVDVSNSIKDKMIARGAKTTQLWSSILPAALVASGHYTASLMNGKTVQDHSAIKVIVKEAGGRVTDFFGDEQRGDRPVNGYIASNGVIHDELVAMIRKEQKDEI